MFSMSVGPGAQGAAWGEAVAQRMRRRASSVLPRGENEMHEQDQVLKDWVSAASVAGQPELASPPASNVSLCSQPSRLDHGPNALCDRVLTCIKLLGLKFSKSLGCDHCGLLPARARASEDDLVDFFVGGGAHLAARTAVCIVRTCHLGIEASRRCAVEKIALDFLV